MVSSTLLVINLIISIAIILLLILKFKLNPTIGLIVGALYMGLFSKLGLVETVSSISSGFGGLMAGIGLSIGFGVILGQLLSDCGGAKVIASTMVKKTSEKNSIYAIGFTAFLLSIPVFYDVTFVILIPLGIALAKEAKKPLPYVIGAMVIGAATAHTLVPPTPNPLAAASIFNFDLGIMVLFGGGIGLIVVFITMKIYFKLLDKGLWKSDKDETGLIDLNEKSKIIENPPTFFASILPIIVPIILILLGTVTKAILGETPIFIVFLSNKIVALLIGVILAYIVASKSMDQTARKNSAEKATMAAGIVLLITGAGGSFGNVINATKIGNVLVESIGQNQHAGILVILITYGIAMIFRIAQGSGTVASITTMTIMASVAPSIAIHPVWIALAALAGGISIGHVNDSGFWVTANLSGLTVSGGLKTYTLAGGIVSILTLIFVIVGSIIIPMA
ncbi:MAG: GntP family permease [Spirochaetia bacterium]|nr:GntP family permease [Spirochaetia bacterium]